MSRGRPTEQIGLLRGCSRVTFVCSDLRPSSPPATGLLASMMTISSLAILLLVCANGTGAISSAKANGFDGTITSSLSSAAIQQTAATTCKLVLPSWCCRFAIVHGAPAALRSARRALPYPYLTFAFVLRSRPPVSRQ